MNNNKNQSFEVHVYPMYVAHKLCPWTWWSKIPRYIAI